MTYVGLVDDADMVSGATMIHALTSVSGMASLEDITDDVSGHFENDDVPCSSL